MLKIEKRKLFGNKIKKLRKEGVLPANIYGRQVKSLAVQADQQKFQKLYDQVGTTGLVELEIKNETKKRPVLIHNVQLDPVSDSLLHADFYQVDLTKKVITSVPIELAGEAPAAAKGGVLVQVTNEVEVEALPADLPDKFIVDVSQLAEIGDHITMKKLDYDKDKVSLKLEDLGMAVVQIEEPAKEEEEEKPAPEEKEEGEEGEEKEKGKEEGKDEGKEEGKGGDEEVKEDEKEGKGEPAKKS